jgi:Fur family ferric uptake transcriptional regulator
MIYFLLKIFFNKKDRMKSRDMLEEMTSGLRSGGRRLTAPRAAVARVLAEAHTYLDPEEIRARAVKFHRHTGLVTVYRTLDLLVSQGAVNKIHTRDGCHAYAAVRPGHKHHVVCNSCRSIVEFEGCDLSALFAGVQRQTGYQIREHWLELTGLCPACRKAAKE